MLQMQLATTQQQLWHLQTQSHSREQSLAASIKSCRLSIPCKAGSWTETQRLCSLDEEVAILRQFVQYQYQHEMLWGEDEIHSPRFWYEQGGFNGVRTGPEGDGGVWRREVKGGVRVDGDG